MKVQIEIEIPDGHEVNAIIKDGLDFGNDRCLCKYTIKTRAAKPFLINGVPSDWPEWLDCDWVAKDRNEKVFGYDGEPPKQMSLSDTWKDRGEGQFGQIFGTALIIPGPWDQSLRENPRRRK